MIKRLIAEKIKFMAKKMPVLSITGPRQSGKTTLAKMCFPGYNYLSLESPDTLDEIRHDPRSFLKNFKKGLIIDEAQLYPELFSYLQTISDERGKTGEYVITGSQNFLLSAKISQSLAGRVFVTHLLPFSIQELAKARKLGEQPVSCIYNGFYPRLHDKKIPPELFFPSYIQTYMERDVQQIVNVGNLFAFRKFMRMAAGRAGQLLNFTAFATELGIDLKTVKSWFSILEASFIVFFLPPHYKNFNKRLVKTSKLYFYDTGLACSLLGIKSADELETHWAKGALFENMIIADLMKNYYNNAQQPPLYFWRDNTGHELDCLIDESGYFKSAEIKSGATLHDHFFDGINFFNKLSKTKTRKSFLIYAGNRNYERKETRVISWKNTSEICK